MASGANTPTNYYLDTPAVKALCETERKLIDKKCKPSPPKDDGKAARKGGLSGKVSEMSDKLDQAGKASARYKRDRSTTAMDGNAWMDEHCSGLWARPPKGNEAFPDDLRQQIEALADKLDVGLADKVDLLLDAVDDLADTARELIDPAIVNDIMADMALKTGIKAGVGVAGVKSGVVPVLMALWTLHDIYSAAETLAGLIGDKGKAALEAFESISNIGDEVKKALDDLVNEPAKAMSNMMTLMASFDPCIRARKCLLVTYSGAGSPVAQANHGRGCCPGQTGHHIIPDSAIKNAGCSYNKNDAPVMCLEGTSNNAGWGSHGNAHGALGEKIKRYRQRREQAGQSPNTISYDEMANTGIEAVREVAAKQCDAKCLRAQLDAYYKDCKDKTLIPTAGQGPFYPRPEPTKKPNPGL